jgi:hypothetical protein
LQIIIHPFYSGTQGPDIDFAIIELSSPVEFDNSTRTICLPNQNKLYHDKLAQVTGWGNTNNDI